MLYDIVNHKARGESNMPSQKSGVTKEDLKNFKEEIVHQFHVISEDVISQVKLVAEGVATVNERLERTRQELKEEIDTKTQPIAQAVAALDGKVVALDGKVAALDGKVDRIHPELKTEIQETRQEILAAIKFSYAELDKRLTTLEKEFLELKLRVEKIENRSTA